MHEAFEDVTPAFQFSATEIAEAIAFLREIDAAERPFDLTRVWEADSDEALDAALEAISSAA